MKNAIDTAISLATERKDLIEALEAVLFVIAIECKPSESGLQVVKHAKSVLEKAKGVE